MVNRAETDAREGADAALSSERGPERVGSADGGEVRRGGRTLSIVFLVLALGLVGWIASRVRETMAAETQRAKERAASVVSAKQAADEEVKARKPEIVSPVKEAWSPTVRFEGSLQPVRDGDLAFKTGGRILSIRARLGDFVKQGAVLATLESNEARAQHDAAEASVRAAEAQVAMATDNEARMARVVEKGALANATAVQAKSSLDLAKAQADAARAQLALARANLENHTLIAPYSGYVTRAPSAPGVIVGPGIPLFHLSDISVVRLAGTVAEQDAALFGVGSTVEVDVDGKRHQGRVVGLVPALDPTTRRVPVEAELENAALGIRSGALVIGRILGAKPIDVLKVPVAALRPGSQDEVMVVDGSRLSARRILFTTAPNGDLYVRSGLSESDRVLLSPSPDAKDGDVLP